MVAEKETKTNSQSSSSSSSSSSSVEQKSKPDFNVLVDVDKNMFQPPDKSAKQTDVNQSDRTPTLSFIDNYVASSENFLSSSSSSPDVSDDPFKEAVHEIRVFFSFPRCDSSL
jgi:hypothetical protein